MRTDTVPEIGYTREAFNRTVAHAAEYNVSWVIPWIALGCGYPWRPLRDPLLAYRRMRDLPWL